MRNLKTTLAVLGAVTILLLAGNTVAQATTGHSFLLGSSNSANAVTSLTRTTSGTALKVTTKYSSNTPFVVNGKGKVANLQADKVDGYEGSQMLNKVYVYTKAVAVGTPASAFTLTLHNVPAGKYVFNSDGFIYVSSMTTEKGCVLTVPSTGRDVYEWFRSGPGVFIMPNGSGYVVVPTTQDLTYRCYDNSGTDVTWNSYSGQPLQLIFTQVASVTAGAEPVASRVRAGRTATR